jgi:hypothetical protein
MPDTQIRDGIKYFYIENVEKISLLEEKLPKIICLKLYYFEKTST